MKTYRLIATATFGLESVVRRELFLLGYKDTTVQNGKVYFTGNASDIAKCNLWLRSSDRVLLEVGQFKATTFDQLYEHVRNLTWQEYLEKDSKILVDASSVKSTLFSLKDIQKISKKAIIDKLMFSFKTDYLPESGNRYRIKVAILKDLVSVTLDTSGTGLHKRGYRIDSVEAPMKETLAAALIQLSFWNTDRVLYDVFCGSGTIPIEAAMIGRNIAPGIQRDFDFKYWEKIVPKNVWKKEIKEAYQAIKYEEDFVIYASDISAKNIEIAKRNAEEAGVEDLIQFSVSDFKEVPLQDNYSVLISNPPYGERLMTEEEVVHLTKDMKKKFGTLSTWSLYFLTSLTNFEKIYGKQSDKRRKLYNGRIETWFYQYYGKRPQRKQ
jgi:putative N6-adenine-specific DNA methylase